jgi:hypothetical protein
VGRLKETPLAAAGVKWVPVEHNIWPRPPGMGAKKIFKWGLEASFFENQIAGVEA